MTLRVSLPAGTTCDLAALARGFEALHDAFPRRATCTFGIERRAGRTELHVSCPPELRRLVEAVLYAAAPGARIDEVERPSLQLRATVSAAVYRLAETGDIRLAVARVGTSRDPLRILLAVMERLSDLTSASVVLAVRPSTEHERRRAVTLARRIERLAAAFPPWLIRTYLSWRVRNGVMMRLLCDATAAIFASVTPMRRYRENGSDERGRRLFRAVIAVRVEGTTQDAVRHVRELAGALATFGRTETTSFRVSKVRRGRRNPHRGPPCLLVPDDLAALWHPPPRRITRLRVSRTLNTASWSRRRQLWPAQPG